MPTKIIKKDEVSQQLVRITMGRSRWCEGYLGGEEVRALINRGMKGFQMRLRADAKDFSRTSALWPFIFPQTVFNSFVMAIKMCGPFSLST